MTTPTMIGATIGELNQVSWWTQVKKQIRTMIGATIGELNQVSWLSEETDANDDK